MGHHAFSLTLDQPPWSTVTLGQPLCHYGNGVLVSETFVTMARAGVGGGSTPTCWMGDLAAAPGDSGSALGRKWQVSAAEGFEPHWRGDGKRISSTSLAKS